MAGEPAELNRLAVIVPVLDEAEALPVLLDALIAQSGLTLEIIVADGGSTDDGPAIATARGARIVRAERGRAAQMNAGAAAASAPWLLFLHADSHPTDARQLGQALAALRATNDDRVAGHFALRFQRHRRGNALLFRYMEAKTATNRADTINGDQGLLISAAWFDALGGFDTGLPFLEDQRLAARIRRSGRWMLLPGPLRTSARRFEAEGARGRYLLMAIIMAMQAIDMREFFRRTPAIYRAQQETGPLLVTPYFRLLRRLMRELGPRESLRRWYAVGGYVLGQSWQLFFIADIALRPIIGERLALTRLHDRVVAPLIHHRVGRAVTMLLAFTASMGVIALWCRWRERRQLRATPGL